MAAPIPKRVLLVRARRFPNLEISTDRSPSSQTTVISSLLSTLHSSALMSCERRETTSVCVSSVGRSEKIQVSPATTRINGSWSATPVKSPSTKVKLTFVTWFRNGCHSVPAATLVAKVLALRSTPLTCCEERAAVLALRVKRGGAPSGSGRGCV
jgi:hypothetical protein